jgi:hypothetical protein
MESAGHVNDGPVVTKPNRQRDFGCREQPMGLRRELSFVLAESGSMITVMRAGSTR